MSIDPRAAGERIEQLLDSLRTSGPVAHERAEDLLRTVVDLYGAGLTQLMELAFSRGLLTDDLLEDLAADELVSSLLLVHGLHPLGVEERIERALAEVRPYLGSHGGDVHLLEVTAAGVARLRMTGSCDGCPSSSVTLQLAVEGAITAAAPEIVDLELEQSSKAVSVIPLDALTVRLRENARWRPAASLSDVGFGTAAGAAVDGVQLVLCRVADEVFAYRDRCPSCEVGLAGGRVDRTPGRGAVLVCPGCGGHYDVRRAGESLEHADEHLDPLPLLLREGIVEVAVPTPALT